LGSLIRRICVFCGSSKGTRPSYAEAARKVGGLLGKWGVGIVYGGGQIGMMGILADAALEAGGEVIGVIPRFLIDRELGHSGVTELRVVETMHERKALMADLSQAFIALPGGFGTLEELCEMLTWSQLGLHNNPCGVLNIDGFFDPLLSFLDHAVEEGFLAPPHRDLLIESRDPELLMDGLFRFVPQDAAVSRRRD
jgi:uncharacterized protein (TIGR00730 family)